MRNSIILSMVLLGASTMALPHIGHNHEVRDTKKTWTEGNNVYVEDVVVVTKTLGQGSPAPTPANSPPEVKEKVARPTVHQQDIQQPPAVVVHSSSPAPVAQNAPPPSPAAVQAGGGSGSDSGSGSGSGSGTNTGPVPGPSNIDVSGGSTWTTSPNSMGKSIIGTANYWRNKWNPSLGQFHWDSTLADNARKTAVDAVIHTTDDKGNALIENEGGANFENHMLNPGSMGQCEEESDGSSMNGDLTPFENAWLVWICERSNGNVPCDQIGIYHTGYPLVNGKPDVGHADIIAGPYTKIGCYYQDATESHPNFKGIWTCDFA